MDFGVFIERIMMMVCIEDDCEVIRKEQFEFPRT